MRRELPRGNDMATFLGILTVIDAIVAIEIDTLPAYIVCTIIGGCLIAAAQNARAKKEEGDQDTRDGQAGDIIDRVMKSKGSKDDDKGT